MEITNTCGIISRKDLWLFEVMHREDKRVIVEDGRTVLSVYRSGCKLFVVELLPDDVYEVRMHWQSFTQSPNEDNTHISTIIHHNSPRNFETCKMLNDMGWVDVTKQKKESMVM